jgi:hypothetical protein
MISTSMMANDAEEEGDAAHPASLPRFSKIS